MIVAGLCAAVIAVWANSLSGAFVLDDLVHLVDNPGLDRLMSLDWTRHGPFAVFRPVLMFTFALNVAVTGRTPTGFHVVNLAIHLASTLLLFGLVRRTLSRPALRARCALHPGYAAAAVALLWSVHPLHTESVTYICQRGESLMGLLHLATLYCAVRAHEAPDRRRWTIGAWLACALGMGAKESMVVVPIAVVLYDRCFLYPSLTSAFRERKGLWAGLVAGWLPLVLVLPPAEAYTRARPGATDAIAYALTQPGVILHYMRLSLWPVGLVLEEDWRLVGGIRQALPALAGLAVIAATLGIAARRFVGLGGVGLWAALVLAPTSSVVPLRDPAVEHRMYLPLVAVAIFTVVSGAALLRRIAAVVRLPPIWPGRIFAGWVLGISLVLGWMTVQRNALYRSPVALYADVVAHRPDSIRGHQNLAWALAQEGRLDEAIVHTRRTIELNPEYAEGWYNLGVYLRRSGRPEAAIAAYRKSLALRPDDVRTGVNLNVLLREVGMR